MRKTRTGDETTDGGGGDPRVGRSARSRAVRFVAGVALITGAFAVGALAVRPSLVSHGDMLSLPPVDLPDEGLSSPPPPPAAAPGSPGPATPSATASTSDGTSGPPHSTPVSVSVPRVGIDARTTGVDLDAKGEVQVPKDNRVTGWYRGGPSPGDADTDMPAVVVGHVDSRRGPAVFYRLREVRPGDTVSVRRADGSTALFVVYRVAEYPKATFPAAQVFAATNRPELRLITCTGVFDGSARSYLSNFVAYAALQRLVPAHPATSATPARPSTARSTAGASAAPPATVRPAPGVSARVVPLPPAASGARRPAARAR